MKLYVITVAGQRQFAGSEAAAKAAKREMLEVENLGPRSSEATINAIEVPTGKAELIEFLNKKGYEV